MAARDVYSLRSPQPTGPRPGFTLIELLMVVAILGIAATVAISTMGDTADMQARAAARELMATMLYAQTFAISTQQDCKVIFDADAESFAVRNAADAVVTNPYNPAHGLEITYPNSSQYRRVTLSDVDFNGESTVLFDDLGAPYDGDGHQLNVGHVTLTAGGTSLRIDVTPVSGRISITEL